MDVKRSFVENIQDYIEEGVIEGVAEAIGKHFISGSEYVDGELCAVKVSLYSDAPRCQIPTGAGNINIVYETVPAKMSERTAHLDDPLNLPNNQHGLLNLLWRVESAIADRSRTANGELSRLDWATDHLCSSAAAHAQSSGLKYEIIARRTGSHRSYDKHQFHYWEIVFLVFDDSERILSGQVTDETVLGCLEKFEREFNSTVAAFRNGCTEPENPTINFVHEDIKKLQEESWRDRGPLL